MADVLGLLQSGVGNLLRQAGLELMHLVMDEEVQSLAGERHEQHEQRRAHRSGKEEGYCVIDGQKVPIERTRLRNSEKREVRLGSYERCSGAERRWSRAGMGQGHARPFDAELRGGRAGFQ